MSGCTAAYKLACRGAEVILVEKASDIGGRVRSYGCKAVDRCLNCGVCLSVGLWDKVLRHRNIHIHTDAVVTDISGAPGAFSVAVCGVGADCGAGAQQRDGSVRGAGSVCGAGSEQRFDGIDAIVVSTGFDSQSSGISSHLHIEGTQRLMTGLNTDGTQGLVTGLNTDGAQGLMTGSGLERLLLGRTSTGLFKKAPESVAFIQCLGSRDKKEGGLYCSRVCCSYSTRAAKVIRSYYPQCEIVFFYMELQSVENSDFFADLKEQGMEFIECRPLKICSGTPASVEYEDPKSGITSRNFDLVVLSDGIHAGTDNARLAEICSLSRDSDGFLSTVGGTPGVYVAGCAGIPMKIDETYADALTIVSKILAGAPDSDTRTAANNFLAGAPGNGILAGSPESGVSGS